MLIVSNSAFKMSKAEFSLPSRALSASVKIYDQRGAVVREFSPSWDRSMMVSWDGHNQSGNRLPAGVYAVRVSNGRNHAASEIALMPR
jgi:flagellar hook assembly protein FlgD